MNQFNVGAALAGLTFAATGLLFLLDAVDAITLRTEVVIPSVVIALGASAILGALTRPRA